MSETQTIDKALRPCPNCGGGWAGTELLGAANRGGGYRVLCHNCGHRWDDVHASHHVRETAWRKARGTDARPPWVWCWPVLNTYVPADRRSRLLLNRYPDAVIGVVVVLLGRAWGVRWKRSPKVGPR